jgi:hypothetical protein
MGQSCENFTVLTLILMPKSKDVAQLVRDSGDSVVVGILVLGAQAESRTKPAGFIATLVRNIADNGVRLYAESVIVANDGNVSRNIRVPVSRTGWVLARALVVAVRITGLLERTFLEDQRMVILVAGGTDLGFPKLPRQLDVVFVVRPRGLVSEAILDVAIWPGSARVSRLVLVRKSKRS